MRKLSFNEKLYTLSEELSPPFAIQVIIGGEGLLQEELLQESLSVLVSKIPALQLKIRRNHWYFNRAEPKIFVHNCPFSGDLNSAIFRSKLSARKGHSYEFHAFQGDSTTLVIRVLHSLMDGVGVLTMIDSWFDLINGREVKKIDNYPRDEDFRKTLKVKANDKREAYSFKWKGVGKSKNYSPGLDYVNGILALDYKVNGLIGKLAQWHVSQTNSSAQFLIPVNIRRHKPELESVANLSLPIYLKAETGESADEIQANLLNEIYKNNELARDRLEGFGKITPPAFLKPLIKWKIRTAQRKNLYPMSGFISDLGYIDIDRLKTETYKTTDIYLLPVYTPLAPFSVLSCQHRGGSRVGIAISDKDNLNSIRKTLTEFLQPEFPEPKGGDSVLVSPLAGQLRKIWSDVLMIPEVSIQLNDSYTSHGGSSLSLLLIISKIEEEILKKKSKKMLTQIIRLAGKVNIRSMEEILTKPENS